MYAGVERVLQQERYIPTLERNLISLWTLDSKEYEYKASSGVLKVTKGCLVVMKGFMKNGRYVLQGSTMIGSVSMAEDKPDLNSLLWHRRLGHASERGLMELSKQGLLGGDALGKIQFCENCVLGKTTRLKFRRAEHVTTRVLNYIHSNLWGPSKHPTLGGGRYFLSIIDNFSRKVWIYILKIEEQAFQKFKEWKMMVEVQTGRKVKKLRTDNGWEFVKSEFEDYCKMHDILRHKTVAYTPQQNGLAERMKKSILERVRCMLSYAKLPKSFWGEAINTAVYLINRCPSVALNFKVPKEVWNGVPPNYKHMRTFGCVAYAHVSPG